MSPTTSTQSGTNQLIGQAQQQGQALQNQYNQQATQYQGQYGADVNKSNQAYNQLQQYTQNMPNYGSLYGQYQKGQQADLGYNPATTQQAATGLTSAENIMSALPQAVNQMGNYSGATAGQIANNYSNMAGNIQGQVTNANNALTNQLGMFNAAAGAANQQTTQALGGAQLQSQNYQALYTQANQQMATAGQTMTQIEGLQQQQGYLTSEQVNQYQSAYNGYVTAQAAATQANAAAKLAAARTTQANLQNQSLQNQLNIANSPAMSQRTGGGYNFVSSAQGGKSPISAATYAQQTGQPIVKLLQTMAAGGDQGAANALREIQGKNSQWVSQQQNLSPFLWGVPSQTISSILGNTSGYTLPQSSAPASPTVSRPTGVPFLPANYPQSNQINQNGGQLPWYF